MRPASCIHCENPNVIAEQTATGAQIRCQMCSYTFDSPLHPEEAIRVWNEHPRPRTQLQLQADTVEATRRMVELKTQEPSRLERIVGALCMSADYIMVGAPLSEQAVLQIANDVVALAEAIQHRLQVSEAVAESKGKRRS